MNYKNKYLKYKKKYINLKNYSCSDPTATKLKDVCKIDSKGKYKSMEECVTPCILNKENTLKQVKKQLLPKPYKYDVGKRQLLPELPKPYSYSYDVGYPNSYPNSYLWKGRDNIGSQNKKEQDDYNDDYLHYKDVGSRWNDFTKSNEWWNYIDNIVSKKVKINNEILGIIPELLWNRKKETLIQYEERKYNFYLSLEKEIIPNNLEYIKRNLNLNLNTDKNINDVIGYLNENNINGTMNYIKNNFMKYKIMWGFENSGNKPEIIFIINEIKQLKNKFESIKIQYPKIYILVPGDSGYRICKVLELLLNDITNFEFIFFPISGLGSENDSKMSTYFQNIIKHIPIDSKIYIYDKKSFGRSERWFIEELKKNNQINFEYLQMEYSVSLNAGMVESEVIARCQPYYKDVSKEIEPINNSICKYVILYLYYYIKTNKKYIFTI